MKTTLIEKTDEIDDSTQLNSGAMDYFEAQMSLDTSGRMETTVPMEDTGESDDDNKDEEQAYIGETARTLRQRSIEHWNKPRLWSMNSFILRHWMIYHGTLSEPPGF